MFIEALNGLTKYALIETNDTRPINSFIVLFDKQSTPTQYEQFDNVQHNNQKKKLLMMNDDDPTIFFKQI